jgi:hypothetical protein
MRSVLYSLALIVSGGTAALAQAGPNTTAMTCNQARGLVASQGAVVLHTGPVTYDRFVSGPGFCTSNELPRSTWVGTADTAQCFIGYVCRQLDLERGR